MDLERIKKDKANLKKIAEWCEKIKKERKRDFIIERNPFKYEIPWMKEFLFIEIDRPEEVANKKSLIYNTFTKEMKVYFNGRWKKVWEGKKD